MVYRMNARGAVWLSLLLVAGVPVYSDARMTAIAQEVKPSRILTVTGRGDRPVSTTKAQIQLGVVAEAKTAQDVQAEIARRASAVVTRLQQLNVEKLQTTSLNLSPKYVYENNRQRQEGFVGESSVSFQVPLERAGATLDAVVAAGANRVDRIGFLAAVDAVRAARDVSLQDAVQDARSQADAVLSALNLKAQSIRTIQIGSVETPQPMVNNLAGFVGAAAKSEQTPVLGGEQRVQTTVTLEISY